MKHVGHLAQQVPRAPAHQHHVASLGRLAGRLGQAVQILLMGRVQAEAVGHAHGLFVQPLQFGVRHVLDLGGLMEQFAVEHFPAKSVGKFAGHLAAAGTVLASDGNDFHRSGSWHGKETSPTRNTVLLVGPGYFPRLPYQKENPQGRGHQQRPMRRCI